MTHIDASTHERTAIYLVGRRYVNAGASVLARSHPFSVGESFSFIIYSDALRQFVDILFRVRCVCVWSVRKCASEKVFLSVGQLKENCAIKTTVVSCLYCPRSLC